MGENLEIMDVIKGERAKRKTKNFPYEGLTVNAGVRARVERQL